MTGPRTGWLSAVRSTEIYNQPFVEDTPHQQNANNVLEAVQRFSHKLTVRRFDGTLYDQGRHIEGPESTFEIYGELQYKIPTDGSGTMRLEEHQRMEGDAIFYYDPYYSKNLALNGGSPVYLHASDDRYITESGEMQSGAADIVVVDEASGAQSFYEVSRNVEFPSSSFEEEQGIHGGYCMASLQLHRDHHQARNSDDETIAENDGFADMGDYIGQV